MTLKFTTKTFLRQLVGWVMSISLVSILIYKVDTDSVINTLKSVKLNLVSYILLIVILSTLLRAVRWKIILGSVYRVSFHRALEGIVIGYFTNLILPLRGGEVIRAHYIGLVTKKSSFSMLSTIVIERLFDGLSMGVIILLSLLNIGSNIRTRLPSLLLPILAIFFILLMIFLASYKKDSISELSWFRNLKERIYGCRLGFLKYIQSFFAGLSILNSWIKALYVFGLSSLIWLVTSFAIILSAGAFGHEIGYTESLIVLGILIFALSIPSTPGFVGTFHAGMTYGLVLFGIPKDVALSSSILFHVITFLPFVIWGPLLVYKYGMKINLKAVEVKR
ncbi:MAG: lysylphosphatidylglycerol synthase transmembrane domain-containing protein [Desulfatiglandales bacterium]